MQTPTVPPLPGHHHPPSHHPNNTVDNNHHDNVRNMPHQCRTDQWGWDDDTSPETVEDVVRPHSTMANGRRIITVSYFIDKEYRT